MGQVSTAVRQRAHRVGQSVQRRLIGEASSDPNVPAAVRLWPSFAHYVSLSDAELDSLWANYDTESTGTIGHSQVCALIKDFRDAYFFYFELYVEEEIERRFHITPALQEAIKDKLAFLCEEAQVEQLASALVVGTMQTGGDEESPGLDSSTDATMLRIEEAQFYTLLNFMFDKINPRSA